mmetsp:Transcript_4398/g.9610  ORF Transcript_4398/g.9610 Transcript_4398/m.9610 type:complete len:235 (+) Transcript_4398:345-1049(+)
MKIASSLACALQRGACSCASPRTRERSSGGWTASASSSLTCSARRPHCHPLAPPPSRAAPLPSRRRGCCRYPRARAQRKSSSTSRLASARTARGGRCRAASREAYLVALRAVCQACKTARRTAAGQGCSPPRPSVRRPRSRGGSCRCQTGSTGARLLRRRSSAARVAASTAATAETARAAAPASDRRRSRGRRACWALSPRTSAPSPGGPPSRRPCLSIRSSTRATGACARSAR